MNLNYLLSLSGHSFESVVCGSSSDDVDQRILNLPDVSFFEGIRKIKQVQGIYNWNPKQPNTDCGQLFFGAVAKHLVKQRQNLRMYIALGYRSLERCGVDVFFAYGDYGLATVDLTVNQRKVRSGARVIVRPEDFVNDRCCQVGARVAEILWRSQVSRSTRRHFKR